MVPFARFLHRRDGGRGMSVRIVRYRYRGWDEPKMHPVQDARWALTQLRDQHRDASIVLVGHSMGGRAALRVADHPAVTAVCALAPWTLDDEPVRQLAGRSVLIAHGDREHTTDPRLSYQFAVRAKQVTSRVCRFEVLGDGHAMLRRAHDWSDLTARFVEAELAGSRCRGSTFRPSFVVAAAEILHARDDLVVEWAVHRVARPGRVNVSCASHQAVQEVLTEGIGDDPKREEVEGASREDSG